MAKIYEQRERAALNVALYPQAGVPLDLRDIFYSLEDFEAYVKQNKNYAPENYDAADIAFLKDIIPYSYVGQVVAVVDKENKTAKAYVINSVGANGTYSEVGSSVQVDEKTIDLLNGVLSIHGIGSAGEGYTLVSDGKGGVTWSKPSETTVEGLSGLITALTERVVALETAVEEAEKAIGEIEEELSNKANVSDLSNYVTTEAAKGYATTEALKNKADVNVVDGINTRLGNVESSYIKSIVYTEGGQFAITDQAGNVTNVDLDIEKVVTNFDYNEEKEALELTLADDTVKEVSLSAFIDVYTAAKGATEVQVSVVGKEIGASLVDGGVSTAKVADKAITEGKLADEVVAKIEEGVAAKGALDSKADASALEGAVNRIAANEQSITNINNQITNIDNSLKNKTDATQVETIISASNIQADKVVGVVSEASKVSNALKITVNGQATEYDGSAEQEIVISTEAIENSISGLETRVKTAEEAMVTVSNDLSNLSTTVIKEVQVNGVALSRENGVVNLTQVSTDMLVQGAKTLILDGGTSEE